MTTTPAGTRLDLAGPDRRTVDRTSPEAERGRVTVFDPGAE